MTTITLKTGQVSPIYPVSPGTRITSDGNGSIEYTAGSLTDAKNNPDWTTWPLGSTAGYMDTVRQLCIRATATADMEITLEEGRADKYPDDVYFDTQMVSTQTDPTTGAVSLVGSGGANLGLWRGYKTVTVGINGMYQTIAEAVAAISAMSQFEAVVTPSCCPTTVTAWATQTSDMTTSGLTGSNNAESYKDLLFSVGAETILYPVDGVSNPSGMRSAMRRVGATIAASTALHWYRRIRYVIKLLDEAYDEAVTLTAPCNIEFTSDIDSELALSLGASSAISHGEIKVSGRIRLTRGETGSNRLLFSDTNGWSVANFASGNAVEVVLANDSIYVSNADFMSQYCVIGSLRVQRMKIVYQCTVGNSHLFVPWCAGDIHVDQLDVEVVTSPITPVSTATFAVFDYANYRALFINNISILINDPGGALQKLWICGTIVPNPSGAVATPPMASAAAPVTVINGVQISSLYSLSNLTEMAVVAEDCHGGTTSYLGAMMVIINDVQITTATIDASKFRLFKKNTSAVPGSSFSPVISNCGKLLAEAPTIGGVSCSDSDATDSIAYSASITPNPNLYKRLIVGQLTGNLSVDAPTNPLATGMELTFVYSADATPGRTITYNAAFKTSTVPASTASGVATHSFVYNGANFVERAPLVWM